MSEIHSQAITRGPDAGHRASPLAWFTSERTKTLDRIGTGVLRYGLVALLAFFGALKFVEFEAQAIRPLIENHPLMSWMYSVLSVRGASAVIGVIELGAALAIAVRSFAPRLSAAGSLIAAATFLVTLSFLVTTPGALSPESPIGGFLMKDLILLGAALVIAAEALRAGGAPQD